MEGVLVAFQLSSDVPLTFCQLWTMVHWFACICNLHAPVCPFLCTCSQKRPKEAPAAKARRIAVQTTPAALTQGPVAEEPAGPQAAPAAAATGGSQ
jgi:hypothetical protein